MAVACGAIIGFLAFRFGVAGVYFAILTIAFAEFARIGFDHIGFVNASAGLFLPVKQYAHNDLWRLRGDPTMFYYVILAATVLAFILCHLLLRSRIGYFWLAIREDEQAARAVGIDTFRYKMYAVMISAGVTSFAGVFYAFFYNNLFPEQVFNISRSIEIILGPIIGGIGTLFGPILGAFVLTGLAEIAEFRHERVRPRSARRKAGVLWNLPARRHRGVAGGHVAVAGAPDRRGGGQAMTALLSLDAVSKRFSGLVAVDRVSFDVPEGVIFAVIGPNGAGKTTLFNMIAGAMAPDAGAILFAGEPIEGLAPDVVCRRGIARTFQLVRPFPALSVEDNVIVGALLRHSDVSTARRRAHDLLRRLDLFDKRSQLASTLTLPDRKRLEVARALATEPKLLLLDEVMAGLRPTETDRMVATLREINRESGLTILLIEHVMRAVMALAARVVVLDHGVAIADGTPEDGRARSRRRAVLSRHRGRVMLRVENLDVFYGDAQALDGVSLDIEEGAIVAIVGANGAGKTSLIRTIAGMHRPARGRILFRTNDIAGWPSYRVCNLGIGQVAEGRQIFPTLSVAENLEMGALLSRARGQREKNRERVLALFPVLAERHRQAAGTLSGGEQQMLAIGRCLMGAPELVMFDEPSLGLAPAIVQDVLKTIRDLNREGLTCMLVEQNVALSLKLASRAYVLENGRITLSGTGAELLADDRVRSAYLGL